MTSNRPAVPATAWSRRLASPLRRYLHTETSGARVLLVAAGAALVWANVAPASYEGLWSTPLSLQVGSAALQLDARGWVNAGLMTFFFFVVGLEARREFDMGDLRERRQVLLPVLAGLGGMAVPVALYLAVTGGRGGAPGWGAAMSTDTAFALGLLATVGPRFADRLRSFLLTVVVVDDLVALLVIAVVYTRRLSPGPLLTAVGLLAAVLVLRAAGVRHGLPYAVLGVGLWVAVHGSGVDPVLVGLVMGLLTYAYPAARPDLELASERFRSFREQPTPELARQARAGLDAALSPNDRLQQLYHPWTSYLVVPLFALANAGIPLGGDFLARAVRSPITLGIVLAYVVGKPVGILGVSWLVGRLSGGRLRPPVGWGALAGGGTAAGVGFTVSLLVATLAFAGPAMQEAKAGVLAAGLTASLVTALGFRVLGVLPAGLRARALLGTTPGLVDLADPVDPERDHIRGPATAPVTLVEYGDLECPYCGAAEPVVRELLANAGDLRYVWRHLPLTDVHPHAQLAAQACEAAAAQGAFWPMRDLLFTHQDALRRPDLLRYAGQLGFDLARFTADLDGHAAAAHIARDVEGADLSGVSGTPTFFVNGRRHHGAFDLASLTAAVRAARAQAALSASG